MGLPGTSATNNTFYPVTSCCSALVKGDSTGSNWAGSLAGSLVGGNHRTNTIDACSSQFCALDWSGVGHSELNAKFHQEAAAGDWSRRLGDELGGFSADQRLLPTGARSAGWYNSGPGSSCSEGCAQFGLQCTDAEMEARQADANTCDKALRLVHVASAMSSSSTGPAPDQCCGGPAADFGPHWTLGNTSCVHDWSGFPAHDGSCATAAP